MTKNKRDIQKTFYNSLTPKYLGYQRNIPYARYLTEKMVCSLGGRANSILEVGAGQGRFSFELAKQVKRLTATDLSKHEIQLLEKYCHDFDIKNITTSVQDLIEEKHAIKGKVFDHVTGFFVLHHLPKNRLHDVVGNLKNNLRTGGRLSFIEPNSIYPLHFVEMMILPDMKWKVEKGIYTNYIGEFKRACVDHNLTLIHSEKFGFIPPPFINRYPKIVVADHVIERIPLINEVSCPFILLTFEKE